MADASVIRQPKAIFSLDRAKQLFQEGLDEIKKRHEERVVARDAAKEERKREEAQSRYDKVRDKLVYASAGYSKQAVECYNKIFAEYEKLTPAEKKEFSDMITSGIRNVDKAGFNGQKYESLFNAINDGVKAKVITWEKSTFLLDTMITAGVSVAKITGYVSSLMTANVWLGPAIDLSVTTLKHGLYKVIAQANKKGEVNNILKDDKLMESIKGIEEDIQKLTEELNQEQEEWVIKAKDMKPKEFEQAFGEYVKDKIKKLNLNNISARLIDETIDRKGKKKGNKEAQENGAPAKETEEQTNSAEQQQKPSEVPSEEFADEIIQGLE